MSTDSTSMDLSPSGAPAVPEGSPTTPIMSPTTPIMSPTTPIMSPTTPIMSPTTPIMSPTTPIMSPRAESREPRAESREPSREPRAESREPRAESREPRAESREPRAESRAASAARRLDRPRLPERPSPKRHRRSRRRGTVGVRTAPSASRNPAARLTWAAQRASGGSDRSAARASAPAAQRGCSPLPCFVRLPTAASRRTACVIRGPGCPDGHTPSDWATGGASPGLEHGAGDRR